MIDKKLLDRLKKLLALANDASNENESAIAMKRLHALLVKHDLSMSDITKDNSFTSSVSDTYYSRPWINLISTAIGNLYMCRTIAMHDPTNGRKICIHFVGKEANSFVANKIFKSVIDYGLRKCKSEAEAFVRLNGLPKRCKERSSFETSFLNSYSRVINIRCFKMVEEMKQSSSVTIEDTKFPVPVNYYESMIAKIDAFIDSNVSNVEFSQVKPGKSNNIYGAAAGSVAGRTAQLNESLEDK